MFCLSRPGLLLATVTLRFTLSGAAAAHTATTGDTERVRLELDLPESCAERDRFFAQVRGRLGTAWEAEAGELARTINVTVSQRGARYLARLELTDARGKQVARTMAGDDCAQVIDGVALMTALAIQSQLDELTRCTEPPAEPGPHAPTPAPSAAPLPARAAAGPTVLAVPPTAPASATRLRISGRAGLQHGMGPALGAGFGAFVGLAWPRVSLGLAVDWLRTGRARAQLVPTEFELIAARFEACPRVYAWTKTLAVEPCAFFQAGRLAAQGFREPPYLSRGTRGATSWIAPGLLIALRAELGLAFFGVEASAGFPLDQEQFYVDTEGERSTVYQLPGLTAGAALSAGVVF